MPLCCLKKKKGDICICVLVGGYYCDYLCRVKYINIRNYFILIIIILNS